MMAVVAILLVVVELCMLCHDSHGFVPMPAYPSSTTSTSTPTEIRRKCVRRTTNLFLDGQGMAGGNQHLLGDILRSLQPRYLSQVKDSVQSNLQGMKEFNQNNNVDKFVTAFETDHRILPPTWDVLTNEIIKANKNYDDASIIPSTEKNNTVRLFNDEQTETPIVTLYRDSALWCPYCQKVSMALEEKQIPYEVIKIDMRCYGKGKPTEFLQLQPNGNLPCAVITEPNTDESSSSSSTTAKTTTTKKRVIAESNDIIDALDGLSAVIGDKKGTPTLRPSEMEDMIKELCDNGRESLERRLFARWMWWLTGVRRPEEYKQIYMEHWQEVEDALEKTSSSGPYFLGKELSVVDLRFIPFVERQLASLAYFKGADYLRDGTKYPNIVRWLQAMESRRSYQRIKSDYYTHAMALPPQLAADCSFEDGHQTMKRSIEFWSINVDESSKNDDTNNNDNNIGNDDAANWIEPGWEWYDKNPKYEAAECIIRGRNVLPRFCARGAGLAGWPAASAPLADPSAKPNESLVPAIDVLLRLVVSSLLQQEGKITKDKNGFLEETLLSPLDEFLSSGRDINEQQQERVEMMEALANCIDYLRARVGVPRDMPYPAAVALRKELYSISNILRQRSRKQQQQNSPVNMTKTRRTTDTEVPTI